MKMSLVWLAALAACSGPRGRCGEGTEKVDGACITAGPLLCGAGTFEEDGSCLPEERDSERASDAVQLRLPVPPDTEVWISQAFHGGLSHSGAEAFAVDLAMDEGSTIVASKGGIVLDTRSDSDSGCGDPSCGAQANYVRIDHGDGTVGIYYHLEQGGVDVERGEAVGRGQPIGRSGNTGFSTGPHLHLAVLDPLNITLPVAFEEFLDTPSGGAPYPSTGAVSINQEEVPPEGVDYSACPPDAFAHRGVELLSSIPCTLATLDTDIILRARVEPGGQLALHRFSTVTGQWRNRCAESDDEGVAELTYRYDPSVYAGTTYLMVSSIPADETCAPWAAWATSPLILLTE